METQELKTILANLDQTVLGLGQSIQNTRSSISQCYAQADSLESQAQALSYRASSVEDPQAARQLYHQVAVYMNQASAYRARADELQNQVGNMVYELNGYKSQYQTYMADGQNNLADLKIAAEHWCSVSSSKYGASKLKELLITIKQRIQYNQNLVEAAERELTGLKKSVDPMEEATMRE